VQDEPVVSPIHRGDLQMTPSRKTTSPRTEVEHVVFLVGPRLSALCVGHIAVHEGAVIHSIRGYKALLNEQLANLLVECTPLVVTERHNQSSMPGFTSAQIVRCDSLVPHLGVWDLANSLLFL
jgi:hypothetical protein